MNHKYVYAIGTFGNAFAFERNSGKIVWEHDFRKESPYLDGSLKNNGNLEWNCRSVVLCFAHADQSSGAV